MFAWKHNSWEKWTDNGMLILFCKSSKKVFKKKVQRKSFWVEKKCEKISLLRFTSLIYEYTINDKLLNWMNSFDMACIWKWKYEQFFSSSCGRNDIPLRYPWQILTTYFICLKYFQIGYGHLSLCNAIMRPIGFDCNKIKI